MKITKAVIPAAGLGTRVLPASKSMPKEMLPIVDKPAIQYIVEEAVNSGISDILIITSHGKSIIEDHFDRSELLEKKLWDSGREEAYNQIIDIAKLCNIYYIRQQQMLGLGHAVYCAKSFVGNEPFAVLYGDDVVIGDTPATKELCDAYQMYGLGVAGIKPVPTEQLYKYSSLKVDRIKENIFKISDMIEKPSPGKEFSNYSILGRCLLPPEIFSILENTPKGAGGEIQLTDAMKTLTLREGMMGVEYKSKRYDMGNKLGIIQANVEQALNHNEIGEEFSRYLRVLADKNLF